MDSITNIINWVTRKRTRSMFEEEDKNTTSTIKTEFKIVDNTANTKHTIVTDRVALSQLFDKAVPDAAIISPQVVVVGSQTAGKTRLIISLVFYHLIDNEHFTDEMGEQLLKIFRTGTRMVTRRPTTINLSKNNECKMTINLGRDTAVYPEPKFFEIIRHIFDQSADAAGHAYEEELRVYISAPGLPNRTFTDLPGLITNDRQLTGSATASSLKSIATLVAEYMKNPSTTVVVVEPASVEDFETSQISPLLREIRLHHRPDIFDNSVLVLSKCDKIRDGLEGDIVDKIDLSSAQLVQFPYRYVVGVLNKMEGDVTELSTDFSAFKSTFRATKEYERQRFQAFRNKDGSPLSVTTQCTTSAVFNQMEQISFNMVYKAIQDGLLSLDAKIEEVEKEVRNTLAPPLEFYDQGRAAGASKKQARSEGQYSRMTFVDEFRANFEVCVAQALEGVLTHNHQDVVRNITNQLGYEWPVEKPSTVVLSLRQSKWLGLIKAHFVAQVVDNNSIQFVLSQSDKKYGCLSRTASPFHRVDRLPSLCKKIRDFISFELEKVVEHTVDCITEYISHVWEVEAPKGISLCELFGIFDALRNITTRSLYRVTEALTEKTCFGLEDSLFVESEAFRAQRALLQDRPFALRRQRDVLTVCLGVTSNDELRDALETSSVVSSSSVDSTESTYWNEFWSQAAAMSASLDVIDLAEESNSVARPPPSADLLSFTTSSVPSFVASPVFEVPSTPTSRVLLLSADEEITDEEEDTGMDLKQDRSVTSDMKLNTMDSEEYPCFPSHASPPDKSAVDSLSFVAPGIQQRVRPFVRALFTSPHKPFILNISDSESESDVEETMRGKVSCVRRRQYVTGTTSGSADSGGGGGVASGGKSSSNAVTGKVPPAVVLRPGVESKTDQSKPSLRQAVYNSFKHNENKGGGSGGLVGLTQEDEEEE